MTQLKKLKIELYDYICEKGTVSRHDLEKKFKKYGRDKVRKMLSELKSSKKTIQNEKRGSDYFYKKTAVLDEPKFIPEPSKNKDASNKTPSDDPIADKLSGIALDLRRKEIIESGLIMIKLSIFKMFEDLDRQLEDQKQ